MNTENKSVCLLSGRSNSTMRDISEALAREGLTAIVRQKEGSGVGIENDPEMVGSHWSGQPGKDLFFNGWKLLF